MPRRTWTQADIDEIKKQNPDVEVDYQGQDDAPERLDPLAWTQTEYNFAKDVLEPRLEVGESITWWHQPLFRLPFYTYTADFAELLSNGQVVIYEIKGKYRLGSAGRSSLAVRGLRYFIETKNVLIYRATDTGNGWKYEIISAERDKGLHERAHIVDEDTSVTK